MIPILGYSHSVCLRDSTLLLWKSQFASMYVDFNIPVLYVCLFFGVSFDWIVTPTWFPYYNAKVNSS